MVDSQILEMTPMQKWRDEMVQIFKMKMGPDVKIDEDELRKQLNQIAIRKFKDHSVTLHNNYKKIDVRSTLYGMVSAVMDKRAILGGDACLFQHHKIRLSVNVTIIADLKKKRDQFKANRAKYEKGSVNYVYWENKQKNIKVIINSLYGVMGYFKFHFYNVHLAQSVTATGQAIISTASCGYENFMANNIRFVNLTELLHYINNCLQDYKDTIDEYETLYDKITEVEPYELIGFLKEKSAFTFTMEQANLVASIVSNLDRNCIKLIYYKNNLKAFNRTPYVRNLIREVFDNIDVLTLADRYAFENAEKTNSVYSDSAPSLFEELLVAYRVFVMYNWPIYDRVRRTRYTDKKAVLYIDTDSNFLGLDPYIKYVLNDIYHGQYEDYDNMRFKIASVYIMILSDLVARNFKKFTASLNIDPDYGKILQMKNEYFFTRMAFALVKKRYYGWMRIQEGKLIFKDGHYGDLEIKGFDFIKAGTKATIRDKYKEIVLKILNEDHIQIRPIIDEAIKFKKFVMGEIMKGKSEYFKQVTVSPIARYAKPYSNQGVKSVLIWNAMCPESTLDLPAEIDVIPIKLSFGFTPKRYSTLLTLGESPDTTSEVFIALQKVMPYMTDFILKHPDVYTKIYKNIFKNDNESIANMELNCIAKPRYLAELPDWLRDIIDADKIIEDTVALLTPVLQSTGIKSVSVGAKKSQHYTNMIAV